MRDGVSSGAGRYAPSPSGDLHVGNLRTAALAWLFARSTGRRFVLRIEDLDRVRPGAAERQLADLHLLGLDWDDELRQSELSAAHDAAIARLATEGLVYECFCTRREIQEATRAPHGLPGAYPGTCRTLSGVQREQRRADRAPALRLRSEVTEFTVDDVLSGSHTGVVDDFVVRRNDGVAAYNLAVVVDDAEEDVDQVVRGDDLLSSTPRQAYLCRLLDLPTPDYAHVPLVLNSRGERLAKRDGAVTLADLAALGRTAGQVLGELAASLQLVEAGTRVTLPELLNVFDPARLPRDPWVFEPPASGEQ